MRGRLVDEYGCSVDAASTAEVAARKLAASVYHLVILDLGVPELRDGEALLESIRRGVFAPASVGGSATDPNVPVVIASGDKIGSKQLVEAFDTQVAPTRFLEKPFTVEQLLVSVAEFLPRDD